MRKKWVSMMLLVVMAVSLLTGCGSNPPDKQGDVNQDETNGSVKTGGVLKIGVGDSLTVVGYTPEMASNTSINWLRCAYETLLWYEKDGSIVGQLATDWSTDVDEATITFTLQEGVKFSDGTDFNAEAVKWNIETYKAAGRSEANCVDSIEIPDSKTVKIHLNEWSSSALESIGTFVYYMSPSTVEEKGADYMRLNTCGTGPFVVSSFEQGVNVKYKKNDDYRVEGQPYLDGVEFTFFSDSTALENALKAGEIDVYMNASNSDVIEYFTKADGYTVDTNSNGLGAVTGGLLPASANADDPFYDVKVRQAFCYAADWDTIISTLSNGTYQRTNQWAVPGSVTYNPNVKGYTYDPQKAKELLTEAGYPNGFDTTIYTYAVAFYEDCATAVAEQLKEVGINASIEIVDSTKGNEMMTNGWKGIFWHAASVGPDLGLYMSRHLNVDGAFYAKAIQHPQDCLDLLHEIIVAENEETKVEKEWELQEKIYDEYALFGIPLWVNPNSHIRYDYVKDAGFGQAHSYGWSPATAWLNK